MAGDAKLGEVDGLENQVNLRCKLEPSSASLQNCLKLSTSGRLVSILCEFGVVLILEIDKDENDILSLDLAKRISVKGCELLEGHDWSNDDELFAVASGSCRAHVFQVSRGFVEVLTLTLYYLPKDISFVSLYTAGERTTYQLAVAGPNGVEINHLENRENEAITLGNIIPLHTDLAIALVSFSSDKRFLAVAAVDSHFGIWEVSSLTTNSKKFWYVHLKTIRITSIEFTTNNDIIGVGCWDGSCHVFKKVENNECFVWDKVAIDWVVEADKVSGTLPGSFVSWSSDGKFLRTTHSKDKCTIIATYDVQGNTSTTEVVSRCHGDSVKGITTFRTTEGNFSLYLLKSNKIRSIKWPSEDVSKHLDPSVSQYFNRELLLENMCGTLWMSKPVHSSSSCRFLWRKATNKFTSQTELFERLNNKAFVTENSSNVANEEYGSLNGSIKIFTGAPNASEKREPFPLKDNFDLDNHNGLYSKASCDSDNEKNDPASKQSRSNSSHKEVVQSYHSSINSINSKDCCKGGGKSEDDNSDDSCGFLQSHQNYNKHLPEPDDLVINETIEAPFVNPILLSSPSKGCKFQEKRANFNIDSDLKVTYHISAQYLIVAVLPLTAYVYSKETNKWNTLIFREAVISCCISKDTYFIMLRRNRSFAVWCLTTIKSLASATHQFSSDCDIERSVMVGSASQCRASIVCLNAAGKGDIITIMSDSGFQDSHITVKQHQVFLPSLAQFNVIQSLYGMVGRFLVFRQTNEKQTGQTCWLLVLPELNISKSFSTGRYDNLGELLAENKRDLQMLQSLVNH